ncbi:MAG: radical SAM protein, partial [Spirochaetota bacterium]|nr:radical SAM protein [Spirochaetota bacterium]
MSERTYEKLYYSCTTMCPVCESFIPGDVVKKNQGIYIARNCPQHGYLEGLICSDVDWYESLSEYDVEPVKPRNPSNEVIHGCPEDCGLCSDHKQIAGTATIEVSNDCNAHCPTCLADNQMSFELSTNDVEPMLERLFQSQDKLDTLVISGGEPTIHPELFNIIAGARRKEIGRIVINSNGIRIAEDDKFLDELAACGDVYVSLHFDGRKSKMLRGTDFEMQKKALQRLSQWEINMVPLILCANGVNDKEIGELVPELLKDKWVKSIIMSMMTYTGSRGRGFPGDKSQRLTIPGALDGLEAGSGGLMRKSDFIPLPMPNPLCASIGYFLPSEDGLSSLMRLTDKSRVIDYIKNANFGKVDEKLESFFKEIINNVYAKPGQFENGDKVLKQFKMLLQYLFPQGEELDEKSRKLRAEEKVKSVYLMQFMDSWSFDSTRLSKCSCQTLIPGGDIIPSCHYYNYYRHQDDRFSKLEKI